MTKRCDVPWWRDRVRGESSKLEIRLRSGENSKVAACDMVMLVGMGEQWCWQIVSWLQELVAYRHQLLKERVADVVIHQELRAIGENSATDGQVLPKYLEISKDPLPPSAEEFTRH